MLAFFFSFFLFFFFSLDSGNVLNHICLATEAISLWYRLDLKYNQTYYTRGACTLFDIYVTLQRNTNLIGWNLIPVWSCSWNGGEIIHIKNGFKYPECKLTKSKWMLSKCPFLRPSRNWRSADLTTRVARVCLGTCLCGGIREQGMPLCLGLRKLWHFWPTSCNCALPCNKTP